MKNVLVIDDEPDITTSVKKGLQHKGFEVDVFNDPLEALTKMKHVSYDLAILDIRMPKMNGFDLFREIRKNGYKGKVCFLTAFEVYYDEFKKLFPDLEIRHFIRKPISIRDLAEQINIILDKK
jgi:DNA-binding response OmpR family regulator